jgi:hypothetical protein
MVGLPGPGIKFALYGPEMNWTVGSMDGSPLIVEDVDDAWLAVADPLKHKPVRLNDGVNRSPLCDCGFVRNHSGPCKNLINISEQEDRWVKD